MIKRRFDRYLFRSRVLAVSAPGPPPSRTRPAEYNEGPPAKGTSCSDSGKGAIVGTMLNPFSKSCLRTGGQNARRIAPATMLLLLRPWHGAQ